LHGAGYTFAGIFQNCTAYPKGDPSPAIQCEKIEQRNPFTGNISCPRGFIAEKIFSVLHAFPAFQLSRNDVPYMKVSLEMARGIGAQELAKRLGEEGVVEMRGLEPVDDAILLQAFFEKSRDQMEIFVHNHPLEWQYVEELAHNGASNHEVEKYLHSALLEKGGDEALPLGSEKGLLCPAKKALGGLWKTISSWWW